MSKGIKQVRKSINERKRMRGLSQHGSTSKQVFPEFPQEEEKHGYVPMFHDSSAFNGTSGRKDKRISSLVVKALLSVTLFIAVALLFQADGEWLTKPKKWTGSVLTEEFPFASVNKWYQDTFGKPMAISPNQEPSTQDAIPLAMPVAGSVSESFQENGTGIMIRPGEQTSVTALRDGVVIFAGNLPDTGKTVIIQHADNSKTTYGYLSNINIHLYEPVNAKQKLGTFKPTTEKKTVYFAIEKNHTFIDPVQVIKVDDAS
ncbi:M23 family metallopeptidase [Virgibacillus siamensis]|uniref:M23 family metallopeptidase n=1 Tax=Virgibacillus siamensis TaxID=480071 RepID=UPI000984D8FA|nr:M23 family metallopeptidase [Virgibacillus siamensis]